MTFARLLLAVLVIAVSGTLAAAQSYPNKPVHILVPYAAGGAVDVLARNLAQALTKTWGSSRSSKTVQVQAASLPQKA